MTDKQRKELQDLVQRLRTKAAKVGPLHSLWDVIFDIEAFLNDRPTMIRYSAEEWIEHAKAYLGLGHFWKPAECEDWPEVVQ